MKWAEPFIAATAGSFQCDGFSDYFIDASAFPHRGNVFFSNFASHKSMLRANQGMPMPNAHICQRSDMINDHALGCLRGLRGLPQGSMEVI